MNATVTWLTTRTLLGRRRVALLVLLPLALLALSAGARLLAGVEPELADVMDEGLAAELLGGFGLATLLPLLGLIAGTGAIGREIDDGSIVYLLSKPLRRSTIVFSKLVVAVATVTAFGAVPVLVGGVILTGEVGGLPLAYGIGSLAAAIAYSAVFLLLAVLTRNAVVVGLLYALVWESLIGQFVPGAQALSIQQWALALTEQLMGERADQHGVASAVGLEAIPLLVVTIAASTWYASRRLRTLRLTDEG